MCCVVSDWMKVVCLIVTQWDGFHGDRYSLFIQLFRATCRHAQTYVKKKGGGRLIISETRTEHFLAAMKAQ